VIRNDCQAVLDILSLSTSLYSLLHVGWLQGHAELFRPPRLAAFVVEVVEIETTWPATGSILVVVISATLHGINWCCVGSISVRRVSVAIGGTTLRGAITAGHLIIYIA
jgi:hypothetical protein